MSARLGGRSADDANANNRPERSCILTVNGGSSSLKFALFGRKPTFAESPERMVTGRIERVGLADAQATVCSPNGTVNETWAVSAADLGAAAESVIDWLERHVGCKSIGGVGHRVVHGGPRYHRPTAITAELIEELRRICSLDVDHLPAEIALVERFQRLLPGTPQVACFDTGFHHDMPRVAQIVPIPRRYEAIGVRRYGFHGLSYAYLMEDLERLVGSDAAAGRVVLAHLGSGASLAAVYQGKCVDTTMGLTPASGVVMAMRTGDIDPGLPWFLAQTSGITPEQFHSLANHDSGLLGVSETSPDLRDLLVRQDRDLRAAEAVSVFFYHAKKAIGALTAALGGSTSSSFPAESAKTRPRPGDASARDSSTLGIELCLMRNQAAETVITADGSRARVLVIRTDEELMIAREVARLVGVAPTSGTMD